MAHPNKVKVFYNTTGSPYNNLNLDYQINEWAHKNDVEIVSVTLSQGREYQIIGKYMSNYDIYATVVFKTPNSGYTLPSNVASVYVDQRSGHSCRLFWNHATPTSPQREIEYYLVYVKDEANTSNPFELVGKTKNKEFFYDNLYEDKSFTTKVIPVDEIMGIPSTPPPTPTFNYFSVDADDPIAPSSLYVGRILSKTCVLSWTKSTDVGSGVRHYSVYKDGINIGNTKDTTFNVEGLSPATTYTFKVRTVDYSDRESIYSPSITITTIT